MNRFPLKRISAFVIALVVFSALSLTACELQPKQLQPMGFEFTLTDTDLADTLAIIQRLDGYIDSGKNINTIFAVKKMNEKLDYLYHQYLMGELKYYSDLEDQEAYDMYVSGEDAYMTVYEESLRILKKLYQSDLKAKKYVFADWTDKELMELAVSGEDILSLEKAQNDLLREYLGLEAPESEAWSAALDELYFEFVNNAQQLAALYDYDNYYDYAANEIYMRKYSKAQRESFRQSVKEYILPFCAEVDALYQAKRKELTQEQKELLSSLRKDPCLPSNEFLSGYIASFPEEMETVMNHLFDREALVYTESENAHYAAFTDFSPYCDQPFVFLGRECQDMLTLVHELGHYTAFYHFSGAALPYDTGEVHSQGNEWLIMQYLDGKLDPDVYEALLLWRLRRGLDTVILSTIVDEYEEEVYTRKDISSPKALKAIMSEILDGYEGIEQMGTKNEFYLYAQRVTIESPVYYLSYATSELASMSFYMVTEEEGYEAAQEIYVDLCLETPTGNLFFETLVDVGLPDPFHIDTVQKIIESFQTVFSDQAEYSAKQLP